jgi:hypothetical protein
MINLKHTEREMVTIIQKLGSGGCCRLGSP